MHITQVYDMGPDGQYRYLVTFNKQDPDGSIHAMKLGDDVTENNGSYMYVTTQVKTPTGKPIPFQNLPKAYQEMLDEETQDATFQDVMAAYIDAMIWAETDEDGEPLDENYSDADLAQESVAEISNDCHAFIDLLDEQDIKWWDEMNEQQLGHDFYLTRNGHGTGFWDRNYKDEKMGEVLTTWAKTFGTQGLYVGDDGLLYTHS